MRSRTDGRSLRAGLEKKASDWTEIAKRRKWKKPPPHRPTPLANAYKPRRGGNPTMHTYVHVKHSSTENAARTLFSCPSGAAFVFPLPPPLSVSFHRECKFRFLLSLLFPPLSVSNKIFANLVRGTPYFSLLPFRLSFRSQFALLKAGDGERPKFLIPAPPTRIPLLIFRERNREGESVRRNPGLNDRRHAYEKNSISACVYFLRKNCGERGCGRAMPRIKIGDYFSCMR